MAIQNKYAPAMSKKTDAELIRILTTDKDSYQPDALEAAEFALKNRKLTVQQLATAEETHTTIIADETAKAEEPLGLVNKIWTFIIPFRAFMISMTYRADGYDTKADDIRKWGLYGIGFYIVLMLLISRSC